MSWESERASEREKGESKNAHTCLCVQNSIMYSVSDWILMLNHSTIIYWIQFKTTHTHNWTSITLCWLCIYFVEIFVLCFCIACNKKPSNTTRHIKNIFLSSNYTGYRINLLIWLFRVVVVIAVVFFSFSF